MKVIFLDVDGVLNTPELIWEHGNRFVCRDRLSRLATIVERTGAILVLSSTWRLYSQWEDELKCHLHNVGLKIHDRTPDLPLDFEKRFIERWEEIKAWLDVNPGVEKFAIIDDFPDANIGHSFFRTDETVGLTVEIQNAVIAHLNGEANA